MIEQVLETLGLTKKIATTIETDLVSARATVATQEPELVTLRADLATAKQTIGTLQGQVAAHQTQHTADLELAKTAAATAAAAAETRVPILAASIVAAQGVPAPLPIKPDTQPANAAGKTPESKLKGRARLVAAIEAELNPS
jgi:hypothetical protein